MGNHPMKSVRLTAAEAEKVRREGFEEGLNVGRREIVDWLQHAYLDDPGRPDRGTPQADAILEMARAASMHFRGLVTKPKPLVKKK